MSGLKSDMPYGDGRMDMPAGHGMKKHMKSCSERSGYEKPEMITRLLDFSEVVCVSSNLNNGGNNDNDEDWNS